MSRLVPHPLLSAGLTLMWLMLTRFSPGHLLLGGAIALLAGWTVERLHPPRPRIRRWQAIPRLAGRVARDVIAANLSVARAMIPGSSGTRLRSGFVTVRLGLRDRNALAVLAMIVTATPGTCWLEYDPGTGLLLLHVLDLDPEEDWQALIRDRYESLLTEIFE